MTRIIAVYRLLIILTLYFLVFLSTGTEVSVKGPNLENGLVTSSSVAV